MVGNASPFIPWDTLENVASILFVLSVQCVDEIDRFAMKNILKYRK